MLALTFANPSDYDKILEEDRLSILGLKDFSPDKPLTLEIVHADGIKEQIELSHSYNKNQIEWFRAGGALNLIAKNG
jgi:aconitate hydratase